MEINRTINLNGQIKVNDKIVAHLNAGINSSAMGMNITLNIVDKELAMDNEDIVIDQYTQFEQKVKETAKELGYPII
ncbi:hypothetical protein HYG86_09100 [Alkalicella caledoniensis]|uniref:Uncharacterized protein n=1 Tax=Alkalicella caledoniensis TaxID=2731377 RepID=A0A7G9W8A6_ALKCA|nr:hypothetical protein [Alkalicella caledoniensis]QNO14918.1 hypothetical protein HYG86_09100 [Alkalicella caledoniensis]